MALARLTSFLLCLSVGFALSLPARATDAPDLLAPLLEKLRSVEALSAHFREEKRMALLTVPLISEGELHYQKPRSLVRHTRTPAVSSLLLEGTQLSFGDLAHVETVSVARQPALAVLVDALIGVLSGDRAGLERAASLEVDVTAKGAFRIIATPTRDPLRKLVRVLEFEGTGSSLQRMRLVDANGDETITTFTDVRLRCAFDAAERARLFRIGG